MRRLIVLLMICVWVCGQDLDAGKKEKLPNVVFILADDIGYGDIGCYGGKVPTPNIDKLAAQGMLFTDAHTPAALCAPSRFSMLTGSNPSRASKPSGAWNVNFPSIFKDPTGLTKAGRKITVGEVMQNAGYKTAFFGKSHLGGDIRDKGGKIIRKKDLISTMDFSRGVHKSINEYGFDYSYFLPSGIQHAPFAFFENGDFAPFDPQKPADNRSVKMWTNGKYEMPNGISKIVEHTPKKPGVGDVDYNSSQTGIMLVSKAIGFIDDHLQKNGKNKPFMMYYASQAIHVPHTPPNDFDGDDTEINEKVRGMTGGVTSDYVYELDLQVGKILQKIEEEGLTDNTIVFFTSDNGALKPNVCDYGNPEHDNNGDLRGHKSEIYEGGHRVPFIVKWPGKVKEGLVSEELILSQDWVATMYEMTKQNMQEDQAMDCVSLLSLITGKSKTNAPLHPFMLFQGGNPKDLAIREGEWVLILDRQKEPRELYNLKTDLKQEVNLVNEKEQQELVKRLHRTLLKHNDGNPKTQEPRTTKAYTVQK